MVTVSVLRKMTDQDADRLHAAGARFMARHFAGRAIDADPCDQVECLISGIDDREERARLSRLWLAAQRRAVREPSADVFGAHGVIGIRA